MTHYLRLTGLLLATLLLSSCSLFGDDEEESEPKELVKFDSTVVIKRLWTTKVGGESEFLLVGLRPASDGNRIYAASQDGKVVAVDPANGKTSWKVDVETEISAGPSVGAGIVVVAGKDGHIIVLDAASGAEQWRVDIGGESLAPPLVQGEAIISQSIDNRLTSLARFDGRQRWELEQSPPVLTMRGAATPLLVGSTVVAGFDNGRLLAVNVDTGDIEWDSMLALPSGRSDLDRLSDIDGSIAIVGQDIYAGGYQGRVASVAAESGQVLWAREISTHVGVAADWNNVYTARDGGELVALSRLNGSDLWRNDSLLRRDPTLPVPFSTTVVAGDFEGYLHFFNNLSGVAVARVRFGKSAITSEPLVVGNQLVVQSDNGSIAAYVVVDAVPERTAPDISESADES
ncbi:MAG: outer membrane protein assembly factor BamB [Gammaproteobacteria bacterium]|nr:outer membrane protein assembly factor BamB [Gammaproteobacteria bacterium]